MMMLYYTQYILHHKRTFPISTLIIIREISGTKFLSKQSMLNYISREQTQQFFSSQFLRNEVNLV